MKEPTRLIQQCVLRSRAPRRASTAQCHTKWTSDVSAAHAMCIECFRLFVVGQLDIDFVHVDPSNPLATDALLPAPASQPSKKKHKSKPNSTMAATVTDDELHYALCSNKYCAPARHKLLESVSEDEPLSQRAVLSPPSDCWQVSGFLHTGMFMPAGGELEMSRMEQQRYPYLSVGVSRIPDSGRGVFVKGRTLHEGEVVCTVLGQIRAMRQRSDDAYHPLAFDFGLEYESKKLHNREYGLRLFCQTFAAIINSTYTTTLKPNCEFVPHPHFYLHEDYYVREVGVYPSGAFCVIVREGCTIEDGQELLLDYKWGKVLHTDNVA